MPLSVNCFKGRFDKDMVRTGNTRQLQIRQHVKISQQASCLLYQMLMMTIMSIDTNASVMIVPDADHVNTSICPGVSNTT